MPGCISSDLLSSVSPSSPERDVYIEGKKKKKKKRKKASLAAIVIKARQFVSINIICPTVKFQMWFFEKI